jgi:hypothetical protein
VVGNGNASVGSTPTFWGSDWYLRNTLSGGTAPDSFKGFENTPAGPTGCGGTWSTRTGNSPPPPSGLPSYTAMLVTSSVTKSGSVLTGTKPMIVIVHVNPGYDANPGHPATAEVLAVYCGAP